MTGKELEQIYNEGYRSVYWTAMALLKNEADAEDVVQDTFIALMESYDSIKDKSRVMSWLKRTAANKCLDRIKLAKTDNMDDEFFDTCEAVPEDFLPDSIIESEESRRIVMDIINNSLSEEIRRTVILFYFNEMSIKEIAAALEVPEGTVSRRLNSARHKIKKEVEKYEKDKNTKLFGMALPFLSKLLIKEAEMVPFKPMPASLINLSASAQNTATKAGSKIAKEAVKKGTGIMKTKVLIAILAAVAVVTTVVIVITVINRPEEKPETTIESEYEVTEKVTESDVAVESVPESEETQSKYQVYSLDGMSSEEILDMLISFTTDISTGDTLDDYSDRFAVKPKNTTDYYSYTFQYADTPMDYVMVVQCFVDQETDGTIAVSEDSYIVVGIKLQDYDKAVELYDLVYDYLLQNTPNETGYVTDNREDPDSWCSIFRCLAASGDVYYSFSVTLDKDYESNDYLVAVDLPIQSKSSK